MVYNELGKTGLRLSNLSFGASSLGGVFHGIREDDGIRAVHTAVDNGINFIDTRQVLPIDQSGSLWQRRREHMGLLRQASNRKRV